MSARRGSAAAGAVLLLLLLSSGGATASSQASPAETAISSFAGDPQHADASFAAISAQLANPGALQAAALKYVGSSTPAVHFAALYALSLVAAPGSSAQALAALLTSASVNDRVLAAAGLAASGDKRGLPVLIALLGDASWLSYRDPPEHAWQLARVALLGLTTQDLGLTAARTARAATAAQPGWLKWWQTAGPTLRWDPQQRRFVAGASARRLQSTSSHASLPASVTHVAENQVTANGGQVTITVPLDVMGGKPVYAVPGQGTQTADQTAMWKRAAESTWNAAFKRFHYHPLCPGGTPTKLGVHLHLKLDIREVPLGSTGRPNAHKVFFNSDPHFRSYVNTPHWKGTDSTASYDEGNAANATWGPEEPWVIAHEVGHLLGIGDDYTDQIQKGETVSVPNKGREGTLMGDVNGRIDRQLVNRLGKLLEEAGLLPAGAGCKAKPLKIRTGYYEGKTDDRGDVNFYVKRVNGRLRIEQLSFNSNTGDGNSHLECFLPNGTSLLYSGGWGTGSKEAAAVYPIVANRFQLSFVDTNFSTATPYRLTATIFGTFTSGTTVQGRASTSVVWQPPAGSCTQGEPTLKWSARLKIPVPSR